ncbi:uncharacterized protein LOC143368771 [Andrena cerasifolii]|uniref:uncharacterized protein LOC143368771 n=1 Tax=Andrena cerasifolii TaxID=2819439 RepID=UPI004037E17B
MDDMSNLQDALVHAGPSSALEEKPRKKEEEKKQEGEVGAPATSGDGDKKWKKMSGKESKERTPSLRRRQQPPSPRRDCGSRQTPSPRRNRSSRQTPYPRRDRSSRQTPSSQRSPSSSRTPSSGRSSREIAAAYRQLALRLKKEGDEEEAEKIRIWKRRKRWERRKRRKR